MGMFEVQLKQLKREILLSHELNIYEEDLVSVSPEIIPTPILLRLAKKLVGDNKHDAEFYLHQIYFNLVQRYPRLRKEITHPVFFSTALLYPAISPTLESLLG